MTATDKTMKSLLGFLYGALTDGESQLVPQNERERFICWCLPGIPIDPEDLRFLTRGFSGEGNTPQEKAADTARLIAQASRFARLVDFVPDATSVFDEQQQMASFERGDRSLARLYDLVLRFSQVSAIELTPEEKTKLENFRNALYPDVEQLDADTGQMIKRPVEGPMLKAYKRYQKAYCDAFFALNMLKAKAQNPATPEDALLWSFNGPMLDVQVNNALSDWETGGRKSDVEKILAFVTQVTQRDLSIWKADVKKRFEKGKLADAFGQEFFMTSTTPASFAASDEGWSKFKFREVEADHFSSSKTNQWEANASLAWKLNFNADASGSTTETKQVDDVTELELSCGITQIYLDRGWFDPTFLDSRAWRLSPDAGDADMAELSDGGDPPKGSLVAYPISVIFARDVHVNFKELHDETSELVKSIKAGGNASFGLFKLSGSYKRDKQEKKVHSELTENGVDVSGLQILGFRCHLLRKTPDPLPSIEHWT
ncbi:MAG TPA: hypothetical protein VJ306_01645 [Pyrinomonadaceae bacterium]|nr:hypothetical protein [Pyrinomonadaceae bacterium]